MYQDNQKEFYAPHTVAGLVFDLNLQFAHRALTNDECVQVVDDFFEEADSCEKEDIIDLMK